MADRIMSTAATEAIRIAQAHLPRASWKRQKALAYEIVDAINLCTAECSEEIARDLTTLIEETFS